VHGLTFAGLGLTSVGVALPLSFVAEVSTRPAGSDGDNAAQGLVYLQQHAFAYRLSGLLLLVAAIGLIRAATAVPWRTPFLMAIACVAGGLWSLTAALRISSPGPIEHIRGYDEDWGEAAYLVVQMAGTQGALLAGVVLTAFWTVTGSVLAWRFRVLPGPMCALGTVALVYPLASLVGIFGGDLGGGLWVTSIASLIVGVPGWFLVTGIWALVSSAGPTSQRDTTRSPRILDP
jgi:hypothetical protein